MRCGTQCRHCGKTVTRRGINSSLWADGSRDTECEPGVSHEPMPAGLVGGLPVQGVDYTRTGGRFNCVHCKNITIIGDLSDRQIEAIAEAHICEQPQPDRVAADCCPFIFCEEGCCDSVA